jgi:hypothetical protein
MMEKFEKAMEWYPFFAVCVLFAVFCYGGYITGDKGVQFFVHCILVSIPLFVGFYIYETKRNK